MKPPMDLPPSTVAALVGKLEQAPAPVLTVGAQIWDEEAVVIGGRKNSPPVSAQSTSKPGVD